MAEEIQTTLGAQVAKYRRAAKLSGEELAQRAGNGLTRSIIANLENGRKKDLTTAQLLAVAYALRISPADLLFDIRHPYALVSLGADEAGAHKAAQWLAREWFGGQRMTTELLHDEEYLPTGFDNAADALTITQIADLLRRRSDLLKKRDTYEEVIRDWQAGEYYAGDPRTSFMPHTLEETKAGLRGIHADLYEIERNLQAYGVDISAPPIHPGYPF